MGEPKASANTNADLAKLAVELVSVARQLRAQARALRREVEQAFAKAG